MQTLNGSETLLLLSHETALVKTDMKISTIGEVYADRGCIQPVFE